LPIRILIGLVLCFAWPLAAVWAQAVPDRTDPSRENLRRQQDVEDAIRGTRRNTRPPQRIVSYDEVLNRPDDIDINLSWAQQQMARGDIKGASATLQRVLLLAPDLVRVRLLNAVLLFRLDLIDEADREFALLEQLELAREERAQIERYRSSIRLARQRTKFGVTLSSGMQYDWNRNASPRSGELLASGSRAVVGDSDRRKSDWQWLSVARFDVVHDLGLDAPHKLHGSISYLRGEQARLDGQDVQVGLAEIGGTIDLAPVSLMPNLHVRRLRLANQYFGHAEGASLRLEHYVSGQLQVYGSLLGEHQRFYATSRSATAPQRSGPQYNVAVGATWRPDPLHRLQLEAGPVIKQARVDYESHVGSFASLSHTWIFERGPFLVTSLRGEANQYDEQDSFVAPRRRRDRIGRLRLSLGLPFAWIIDDDGDLPQLFREMYLILNFEAVRALVDHKLFL
jgi:hypothetical protein